MVHTPPAIAKPAATFPGPPQNQTTPETTQQTPPATAHQFTPPSIFQISFIERSVKPFVITFSIVMYLLNFIIFIFKYKQNIVCALIHFISIGTYLIKQTKQILHL